MPEVNGQLLPVYVLVDESGSMAPYMNEMNIGLRSLHEALLAEPMTAAKVRVSVLGFSDNVVERVHLADLRSAPGIPPLVPRNRTNYGAAFSYLFQQIPRDVNELKSRNYAVHRPAVVFLSDGQPSDANWQGARRQLGDRSAIAAAPNIIACGIGEAQAQTILEVATSPHFAYVSIHGSDVGAGIAKFCTELTKSIVRSGRSVGSGQEELVFNKPDGFHMAIDVI